MDAVPVPATGGPVAVELQFHIAYDCARLAAAGETIFFAKFGQFADGSPKRFPDECNVPGAGGAFPAGTMKRIIGVSIQVVGATNQSAGDAEDDLFEVDLVYCKQLQKSVKMRNGIRVAEEVSPGLKVLGAESFEVHVRAPERLRAARAYTRVSLHGPLSVAVL